MSLIILCLLAFAQVPAPDLAKSPGPIDPPPVPDRVFRNAFEALVEARLGDGAALDIALANARSALPAHPTLAARLDVDLLKLATLPEYEVRRLRRLVLRPAPLMASIGSAEGVPTEEGRQSVTGETSPGLLARWCSRRAVRFGSEHELAIAVDQAHLAVLLTQAHGDAFDRGWARFIRARTFLQNARTWGDHGRTFKADMTAARAHWVALNEPGLRDLVDFELAWHAFSDQGQLGGMAAMEALAANSELSPDVLVAARGVQLLELCVLEDWVQAGELASVLLPLWAARPSSPLRYHGSLGLGVWHRRRLTLPLEREIDQMQAALEHLELAADEAGSEYNSARAIEWALSIYARFERFDEARKALKKCRQVFLTTDISAGARFLVHEAFLEFKAGDFERALKVLDDHLVLIGVANTPLEELATGTLQNLVSNLKIRARVHESSGELVDAIEALMALTRVDDRRISLAPEGYEIFTAAEACETHGFLVELLDRLTQSGVPAETTLPLASACIEHARARLLRRDLGGDDAQTGLARMLDPERARIDAAVLPQLPDGTAELRWFLAWSIGETDEELRSRYVLLARRADETVLVPVGPQDVIDAEVDRFLARWFVDDALGLPAAAYHDEASALARTLLGPARDWFADGIVRVLAMPDGSLERLPLGALVVDDPTPGQSGYAALGYLVRRAEVLTVPSLAILDALPEPAQDVTALGVFVPGAEGEYLPHVALEREALLKSHPGSLALSDEATGNGPLRKALERSSWGWLHLASHAAPSVAHGSAASLMLGDGTQLDAAQVSELPLTRGVRVVLSACGTASGEFHLGEGVLGLWRAFFLAGASSVVATLCEVDDRSAATWMTSFHRHASKGLALATAARLACLDWLDGTARPSYPRGSMVDDSCHPYLWSTYVVVGKDGGPLPVAKGT
jgi:tetratricopeptide (TPR) repeat protein